MKPTLGLVVSGFLGLALNVGAQQGGTQNPFAAADNAALNGAGSSGSQNPFGSGSSTGSADSAGNQNPFGGGTGGGTGSGGTGSGDLSGNQNPFGGGTGSGTGTGTGSSGSNNPVDARLDSPGCPATRAAAPAGQALIYASSPVCPTGDGKLYQSPDGATFYIQCCTHGAQTVIKTTITADFGECMDECSKTDRCSSVQFVAHAKPGATEPYHECKLSEDGGYSAATCGAQDMHSYAFVVDPPAIESPDSAGVLCSTECPFAHGQLYVTSVGESFHMDCSQRHGTQVIYRDRQPSFKSCIEACGRLLACHSVDYDVKRQTCYYGKHQGEPTINATGFASAHSMGCAGACSACNGGRCPAMLMKTNQDPDPSAPQFDNRPFPQDGTLGSSEAAEKLCPGLNGQVTEAGGARFRMTCGSATSCPPDDGARYFGAMADQQRTLDDCAKACATTSGCNSFNFLDTDYTLLVINTEY
ncbi:hypothetical protein N0V88_007140 [Collariella sp. IMI 366227]|nr:hypothetical protein N0V88_007140 [Collariella sp. IMI 366227]